MKIKKERLAKYMDMYKFELWLSIVALLCSPIQLLFLSVTGNLMYLADGGAANGFLAVALINLPGYLFYKFVILRIVLWIIEDPDYLKKWPESTIDWHKTVPLIFRLPVFHLHISLIRLFWLGIDYIRMVILNKSEIDQIPVRMD